MRRTLVIGGSGFVGGHFLASVKSPRSWGDYIAPSHSQLDVTNKKDLLAYIRTIKPHFIINFSAITNMDKSEKERNDKNGITWRTNYLGVRNLVKASRMVNYFLIQISTDAVFPGTEEFPGPYRENDKPQKSTKYINWYGYTKLMAEKIIQTMSTSFAIIRISHPFGNPESNRDLVSKTIEDITAGHSLFADQLFTPTYLGDLVKTILKIQDKRAQGVFHVGSTNLVSRIEFDRYLAAKRKMKNNLIAGSLKEFIVRPGRAPRTRLGGFISIQTQKELGLRFHSWKNALDKTLRLI